MNYYLQRRKGGQMKNTPLALLTSVALLGFSQVGEAVDGQAPYGGMGLTLSLMDISPDRSLPIAYDPSTLVRHLHQGPELNGDERRAMNLQKRVSEGWTFVGVPPDLTMNIAEALVLIVTNDVETLNRDASQIFRAVGCVPTYPLDHGDQLLHTVGVAVFDDLVFIHGNRLGFVVLSRKKGPESEYRFLRQTNTRRPPVGEVRDFNLGRATAYVFVENRESYDAREWHPVRPRILVFDDHGRPILGDGDLIVRADEVESDNGVLLLRRNTVMFSGPPMPGYSAVMCPHGEAQYSILDAVKKTPVGVQSTLQLTYMDGKLEPVLLEINAISVDDLAGRAKACKWFSDLSEITGHDCFGVHEWDRKKQRLTCLGNADGYLHESWEASRSYWFSLQQQLQNPLSKNVLVDPKVLSMMDSLSDKQGSRVAEGVRAVDLGDENAFSFLRAIE